MVAVVLTGGVADIIESLLETSGVVLDESNTEVQGVLLARLLEVRETMGDLLDGTHDMAALLEGGGGKRQREKRGENEQAGCNHFDVSVKESGEMEGPRATSRGGRWIAYLPERGNI